MEINNLPTTQSENNLLRSERIGGGILLKVLNSFDMVVIVVAIILWIPNAAVVTGAGATAYIYWGLGFITFLIPGAIVTGQLGLMFPGEGSIYVWTTKAFGNFMGFFAGFCAWWPGMLAMIAASDVVVTLLQQLGSLFGVNLLPAPGAQGLVIIVVLALSLVLSILRFRVTQNLVNIIFFAYAGAILLIGLAGILWLAGGYKPNADLSLNAINWSINSGNFTFYGTVILALLGIEVPLNMGVEIKDVRSISRYLLWGSIVVAFAYVIATFGVMMAVPLKDQGNPAGIVEAVQRGFGPFGTVFAVMVDIILIGFFISATMVFNYSYGRLLFVSGLDRRLPAIISKVNTNKVPWVAMLVQTIIGISFTAIIFVLAPLSLKSTELTLLMYDILEAAVAVIWCVSMVILFIDVIVIRYKYYKTFARIQLAPDWIFYLCALTGMAASALGAYVIFTSPWTNSLQKAPLTTIQWDAWITSIAIISFIVAIIAFHIGRITLKSDLSDEQIITEVTN